MLYSFASSFSSSRPTRPRSLAVGAVCCIPLRAVLYSVCRRRFAAADQVGDEHIVDDDGEFGRRTNHFSLSEIIVPISSQHPSCARGGCLVLFSHIYYLTDRLVPPLLSIYLLPAELSASLCVVKDVSHVTVQLSHWLMCMRAAIRRHAHETREFFSRYANYERCISS